MQTGWLQNSTVPLLEQVVAFTQDRHQVLAGNIANLDTPGYRTRDLSPERFEQRLQAALEARDTAQPLAWSEVGSAYRGDPLEEVREDLEGILMHDDTNVGLEQQLAQIAKNQGLHNLALSILGSQFRQLRAAISENA